MALPQVSIRAILFAVILVAADCASLRLVIGSYAPYGLVFGLLGILPMANVLAIACYRSLSRRTTRQPFFVGFALSGALAVLVWFNLCLGADEKRLAALNAWLAKTLEGMPLLQDIAFLIENSII
jgi:hypothetical protein